MQFFTDNYHKDLLDFLPVPEPEKTKDISPPNTPPPSIRNHSFEFDCSYQDEFFTGKNYTIQRVIFHCWA